MSPPHQFYVTLSEPSNKYYAGSLLRGTVVAELKEALHCRALRLELSGSIHTEWQETVSHHQHNDRSPSHSHTRTRTVTATKSLFNHVITLWGKGEQGVLVTGNDMPVGMYQFPFQFQLPPDLESSFQGDHGYIRYQVKAFFDRPWRFDYNHVHPFTVLKPLDPALLRVSNEVKTPTPSPCCLPCIAICNPNRTKTKVRLRTPRMGYFAGEAGELGIDVFKKRHSGKVKEVKVKLWKRVEYRAEGRVRSEQQEISSVQVPLPSNNFQPSSFSSFSSFSSLSTQPSLSLSTTFQIPEVIPPNISTSLISVSYYIAVYVNLEGWWGSWCPVTTEISLVIGPPPLTLAPQITPYPPSLPSTHPTAPRLPQPETLPPSLPPRPVEPVKQPLQPDVDTYVPPPPHAPPPPYSAFSEANMEAGSSRQPLLGPVDSANRNGDTYTDEKR